MGFKFVTKFGEKGESTVFIAQGTHNTKNETTLSLITTFSQLNHTNTVFGSTYHRHLMKLARHRQLQSSSASSQTKEDVAVGQGPVEAGEEVEAAAGEVAKEHLVAVEACSEAPSTRRCFSTS
jgi:hypothetical protein